jgi:hypothetical protein
MPSIVEEEALSPMFVMLILFMLVCAVANCAMHININARQVVAGLIIRIWLFTV